MSLLIWRLKRRAHPALRAAGMQSSAGVKGIRGAEVRGGETGTKWEHLPWAGEESAPARTALGTFGRMLFSKQGPREARGVVTLTLLRLLVRGGK